MDKISPAARSAHDPQLQQGHAPGVTVRSLLHRLGYRFGFTGGIFRDVRTSPCLDI
jgi:hypothetical protein